MKIANKELNKFENYFYMWSSTIHDNFKYCNYTLCPERKDNYWGCMDRDLEQDELCQSTGDVVIKIISLID